WAVREEAVAWPTIGTLTEVVFLVRHTEGSEPVEGTLYLDLRFERLPLLRKLSMFPAARIGGAFLVGLLMALLAALVATGTGRGRRGQTLAEEDYVSDAERPPLTPTPLPSAERGWGEGTVWWRSLKQDLVYGGGAVFTVGLAVAIYLLGERGRLEAGWA